MRTRALIRIAMLLLTAACVGEFRVATAADTEIPVIQVTGSDVGSRFVSLGVSKSVVIDLPRDVKDVLVADPNVANAVIRTARRAYIIGVKQGQTNVFFFDSDGRQIAGFDIAVTRDLNGVRDAIRQAIPGGEVNVDGVGDGIVLRGNVTSPAEAQLAFDIASGLLGGSQAAVGKIVNAITVHGRDQVMLKVTVAEVQRDVIKQLGIDLGSPTGPGTLSSGAAVLDFLNQNPFPLTGQALVTGNAIVAGTNNVAVVLRAMERAGVIRTLAEPNLSAVSGESANFLAGGEFPIPAGYNCAPPTLGVGSSICQYSIEWKKFGVGLNFTPVVMSEGRISLKVMSEVSELSIENQLTIAAGTNGTLTIPSIKTRRAETTVEIPSGGALALAGLIQEQTKQQINGIPGLLQLPVLGTLFRSRDYVNRQTELMIIVTPYIVHSVARKDLSRPDDGFADASDPGSVLLGKLNRIYGVSPKVEPKQSYYGRYGFILD